MPTCPRARWSRRRGGMRIEITAHVRDAVIPARVSPPQPKEGFFMSHASAHQADHARTPRPDFRVTYHGTITTITPLTDAARERLDENVEIEEWQRFGPGIALEPRYLDQVAEAMIEAGLFMEDEEPSGED